MEKGRVGNKRKSKKKDDGYIPKNPHLIEKVDPEEQTTKKANPKCTKCGTEMNHVKTSGLLAVYKCPNCNFTIDQWV